MLVWLIPAKDLLCGIRGTAPPGLWLGSGSGRRLVCAHSLVPQDQLCFFFDQSRAYCTYIPHGSLPTSLAHRGQHDWMQQNRAYGLENGDSLYVWHDNQLLFCIFVDLVKEEAVAAIAETTDAPKPADIPIVGAASGSNGKDSPEQPVAEGTVDA